MWNPGPLGPNQPGDSEITKLDNNTRNPVEKVGENKEEKSTKPKTGGRTHTSGGQPRKKKVARHSTPGEVSQTNQQTNPAIGIGIGLGTGLGGGRGGDRGFGGRGDRN